MNSTSQIVDGVKESTGIDLQALLAGIAGGKLAAAQSQENAVAANSSVDRKYNPNKKTVYKTVFLFGWLKTTTGFAGST